jgi:hypothetical protein
MNGKHLTHDIRIPFPVAMVEKLEKRRISACRRDRDAIFVSTHIIKIKECKDDLDNAGVETKIASPSCLQAGMRRFFNFYTMTTGNGMLISWLLSKMLTIYASHSQIIQRRIPEKNIELTPRG